MSENELKELETYFSSLLLTEEPVTIQDEDKARLMNKVRQIPLEEIKTICEAVADKITTSALQGEIKEYMINDIAFPSLLEALEKKGE